MSEIKYSAGNTESQIELDVDVVVMPDMTTYEELERKISLYQCHFIMTIDKAQSEGDDSML